MELALLWRCPVTWCTVRKGTAQDCVDHLCRISQTVKVDNLARYFPTWTVTRSQWAEMTHLAISAVAIDTLLFSRIGVPLFHRYQIVSRRGTHVALRGTYMRQLHSFLEEMDEEWIRRLHRRRAQEMAAHMSLSSGGCFFSTCSRSTDGFTGQMVAQSSERGRVFLCLRHGFPASGGGVHGPSADGLGASSLCRFGGWASQVHAPWAMSTDSPASSAARRLDTSGEMDREGLESPCLALDIDGLSSSDDDIGTLGGLSDLSVTLSVV